MFESSTEVGIIGRELIINHYKNKFLEKLNAVALLTSMMTVTSEAIRCGLCSAIICTAKLADNRNSRMKPEAAAAPGARLTFGNIDSSKFAVRIR